MSTKIEDNFRVISIQSIEELTFYYKNIKAFIIENQPYYSSHILDALITWFKSFSSEENSPFALKRGINFLGRKSSLNSLFFLLVFHNDEIIAFSPMFRFNVDFEDHSINYEVICFCPDSTVFFYSDILIKKSSQSSALKALFKFLGNYNYTQSHIILLNHIPSVSENFPLMIKYATDLIPNGFHISISPIFWRGGLFPWNLNKLNMILQSAQMNAQFSDQTHKNIDNAIHEIAASNKTMLLFEKNHLALKSSIYRIFNESKPSHTLYALYDEIESIFHSYPVKYPFMKLSESEIKFETSLSSNKRYYYKRYRKQFFAKSGQFEKVDSDRITDQDIHDFISLHRQRWGNNSNVLNPRTAMFLFSFLQKLSLDGFLTLFFARYQDRRIASLCCIDLKKRREFLYSGRSLTDEKLRAGKLLLHHAIIDSIKEGFEIFDFGFGNETYKSDFTKSYLTTNVIALFYQLDPKQFSNLFSLYEKLVLS